MDQQTAKRVTAHGQVQGVFFRDGCQQEAERAGVTGWVRNRSDGTVEALFEGAPDAVNDLVTWMRSGPPDAQVDRVDVEETTPTGESGFRVI